GPVETTLGTPREVEQRDGHGEHYDQAHPNHPGDLVAHMKHDGHDERGSREEELDNQQPCDRHEDTAGPGIGAHLLGDRVIAMTTAREVVNLEKNALDVHDRSLPR